MRSAERGAGSGRVEGCVLVVWISISLIAEKVEQIAIFLVFFFLSFFFSFYLPSFPTSQPQTPVTTILFRY